MANRHVPIIYGVVCLGIGAALILGVGSWWAWLLGLPIGIFGWMSLRLGFSASDDEVAAMTSMEPMPTEMKARVRERISGDPVPVVPTSPAGPTVPIIQAPIPSNPASSSAPAIHPDDRDLICSEDMQWVESLSLDDYEALEKEDYLLRVSVFQKLIKSDGLTDSDARKKIRLEFPTYYWTLEQRADEKLSLLTADAKLPYALKDRINLAVLNGSINKSALLRATSFNAFVRDLFNPAPPAEAEEDSEPIAPSPATEIPRPSPTKLRYEGASLQIAMPARKQANGYADLQSYSISREVIPPTSSATGPASERGAQQMDKSSAIRFNNKLTSEKATYHLPPLLPELQRAEGIMPWHLVLDPAVGMETVLLHLDRTPFIYKLAKVRPFDLRLKSGLMRTSHGPLLFLLFYVPDPNRPGTPFSSIDAHVNPYDPQHMIFWRNLARQSHWHLILVGEDDTLVDLFEFENTFGLSQVLDQVDATCKLVRGGNFDAAKAEFCENYTIDDLLLM